MSLHLILIVFFRQQASRHTRDATCPGWWDAGWKWGHSSACLLLQECVDPPCHQPLTEHPENHVVSGSQKTMLQSYLSKPLCM